MNFLASKYPINIYRYRVLTCYRGIQFQGSSSSPLTIELSVAAPWRKQLDARILPIGSRVSFSVTPCGFRGGRNGVWIGFFSRGFSRFPLPEFHSIISPHSSRSFGFIPFHPPLWWCVRRDLLASLQFTDLQQRWFIPWPGPVPDTSWEYLFIEYCTRCTMYSDTKRYLGEYRLVSSTFAMVSFYVTVPLLYEEWTLGQMLLILLLLLLLLHILLHLLLILLLFPILPFSSSSFLSAFIA